MSPAAFHLLGPDHLAALGLLAALCAGVCWRASSLPARAVAAVRLLLAAVLLGYFAQAAVRLKLAGAPWTDALPLHLCDLAVLICIGALITRHPLAFELSYFWALSGAVAALLTPDLRTGFPSAAYWNFFLGHDALVLSIVWLAAAEGLRPRPGSLLRVVAATNLYIVAVGALDLALGWNYGYLHRKPLHASLLDLLGPWPWYILLGDGLATAAFALLYLPYYLADRRKSRAQLAGGQARTP